MPQDPPKSTPDVAAHERRADELARRFDLATRAAGVGWWVLEPGAERATWSEEMYRIHGLPLGSRVPDTREWLERQVHPEDRVETRRRISAWDRARERAIELPLRIVRTDGTVRELILHGTTEGTPEAPLLFGLVVDVTERRSAELALRQAHERAALAARATGVGTWEQDLVDGTAIWDEQMWRLRGLEPRAKPLDAAERVALVLPEDRELVARHLGDAQQRSAPSQYEFRIQLADGRVRWIASRSTPLFDHQGKAVRRIGVNFDVTDSRTAEAVRREHEAALRENQAKSRFLARMSHELRTPLNAVLGFTQLLDADEQGDDEAAATRRRRLTNIRAAGEHLLSLINDVLDLASLEGGEVRVAAQPVTLAPLVAEVLTLVEPVQRTQGVAIETGTLDAVPLADPTRLRQVLLNLVSNAIKYNVPGGRVRVEAARRAGGVVLRVADTGRGMSDEQLRHLFEPFNRLGIEHEGIAGTGIGLAIVKALAERMGGSVHVDSRPGEGSVFEVRLPQADGGRVDLLAADAGRSRVAATPEAVAGRRRGRLLYIEDNPVNAMIIQELVARRPDLELDLAADGTSGVARAVAQVPDLVLLDMQLPDFDGFEVLRRLRADAATAAVPVIALSANAMPADVERALAAGMQDYWTKPLDFGRFLGAMERMFGRVSS